MPPRSTVRTLDGTNTDVVDAGMGAAGTRFGRNGPAFVQTEFPDPSEVAEALLTRHTFLPARSLNLLAAAWVQFEVHDWMQHRIDPEPPPAEGVQSDSSSGRAPFARTMQSTPGSPEYISDQTHWWDASQLYGVDEKFALKIRDDPSSGRVKTGRDLFSAIEQSIDEPKGPPPVPNLWIGLALFHDLFAREHNAICDALAEATPQLTGDALYDQARLINAAVMAKIHTVEWTPAVIAHPTTEDAIRGTWWGILGERRRKQWGRIGSGELLSGIPGSRTRHDGVRYSLTEEFVAVYRMHPLIPDEVTFLSVEDDKTIPVDSQDSVAFAELTAAGHPERPRERLGEIGCANAFYSLAVAHPGEISLHNFPAFLRKLPPALTARNQNPVDLAVRDIERTRESAVPCYNDFRRIFRLEPAQTFHDLAGGNAVLAQQIEKVYSKVDDVDLMIGLFAERKPSGFAFSDTAFRVFLLMAARRLRSDRFFTTDFTADVYTAVGLRRIESATLAGMLAAHYPALRPALERAGNVFKPWPRIGTPGRG